MAFVMGIRLASFAVAGAALIITHEATQGTKEKLRQWIKNKFSSQSSGPVPQRPKPYDAGRMAGNEGDDFYDCGTPEDTQEPTQSAVRADLMTEGDNAVNGVRPAHVEEPTPTAANVTENAVEGDPTVEQSLPNQDNAINVPVPGEIASPLDSDAESDNAVNGDLAAEPLRRLGFGSTRDAPALAAVDAVSLQEASVGRTIDDVDNAVRVGETRGMDESCQTDSDELVQDAPDPDPPPGQWNLGSFVAAAVNAIKDWGRSLGNCLTAIIGGVFDPKVGDKKRREFLVRIGILVMEMALFEPLFRRHKGWRKFYNVVKNEFGTVWPW